MPQPKFQVYCPLKGTVEFTELLDAESYAKAASHRGSAYVQAISPRRTIARFLYGTLRTDGKDDN